MKILVLGIKGMLGNAVFKYLSQEPYLSVYGTLRTGLPHSVSEKEKEKIIPFIDVLDNNALFSVFEKVRPDVVINCVGLIKQLSDSKDPLFVLPINALFPHVLSKICRLVGARVIHISTDCVFSGEKGMYTEEDPSDAKDLYGRSKYMGELLDLPNAVTLRTSIIGYELESHVSLFNWFLSQKGSVKGYSRAIFSGLTTIELAKVIARYVLPLKDLSGLYHVSVEAIDKFALLKLLSEIYNKKIDIIKDDTVCINRSLDSQKFQKKTGYTPAPWSKMLSEMKDFYQL